MIPLFVICAKNMKSLIALKNTCIIMEKIHYIETRLDCYDNMRKDKLLKLKFEWMYFLQG